MDTLLKKEKGKDGVTRTEFKNPEEVDPKYRSILERLKKANTAEWGEGHSPAQLASEIGRPRMSLERIFEGPKTSQPGASGFKIVVAKHMSEKWKQMYRDLILLIQATSLVPEEFLHTLIAGIPKSDGGLRLIQLMEEPMKQVDDILFQPIETRMYKEGKISASNVAYTPGNSASEAVDWLNLVLADANRRNKKVAVLLYDYSKFFDVARWDMVEAVLRLYGVPESRFLHMTRFYEGCSHELLTRYGKTEKFYRGVGTLLQGGKKSPFHAKLLLELLTRHMDKAPRGLHYDRWKRTHT